MNGNKSPLLIFVLLLLNCNKTATDDLSGHMFVRGTAYFNDTLRTASTPTPLANQLIQIKYPVDSIGQNYIYQVKTDTLGNFMFTNLSETQYYLYSSFQQNGLLFSFKSLIKPNDGTQVINIVFYPDSRIYNILRVKTIDSATSGVLTNVKVCLFGSRLLALANKCDGSITTMQTDQYGSTYFTRLEPGWYYLNASDSLSNVNISKKDSVYIDSLTGFYHRELRLQ